MRRRGVPRRSSGTGRGADDAREELPPDDQLRRRPGPCVVHVRRRAARRRRHRRDLARGVGRAAAAGAADPGGHRRGGRARADAARHLRAHAAHHGPHRAGLHALQAAHRGGEGAVLRPRQGRDAAVHRRAHHEGHAPHRRDAPAAHLLLLRHRRVDRDVQDAHEQAARPHAGLHLHARGRRRRLLRRPQDQDYRRRLLRRRGLGGRQRDAAVGAQPPSVPHGVLRVRHPAADRPQVHALPRAYRMFPHLGRWAGPRPHAYGSHAHGRAHRDRRGRRRRRRPGAPLRLLRPVGQPRVAHGVDVHRRARPSVGADRGDPRQARLRAPLRVRRAAEDAGQGVRHDDHVPRAVDQCADPQVDSREARHRARQPAAVLLREPAAGYRGGAKRDRPRPHAPRRYLPRRSQQ
mmetsp:Transcript_5168/g.16401  ORF Transcript_5168/g.16401 Transcript_5168/m.16401 type:complete len:406 (+) Transcript_5168:2001-3218(+)